ncbi:hypothetical protein TSUD_150810 [Trifolium subterraneum]|uniref:Aminotransferase-like plant mobile domain-containing protein n=1 Tax=Trifolium subterraneum TaxID=3900 RepID=A0A2Z6MIQ6_TRISU|nr:hypothetical protein TSUD_150810 [Trifolium subterraneum]
MTDEVGRTKGGREIAGETQAQQEPQPEPEEELDLINDDFEAGVKEQQDEEDLSDFFDFEDEEEEQDERQELEAQPQPQPQPPQTKQWKKIRKQHKETCRVKRGAHIGFPMLEKIYAANLRRTLKAEKDEESEEVVLAWLTHGTEVLLGWHICITIWKMQLARDVETMVVTIVCFRRGFMSISKGSEGDETTLDRMEVDKVTFIPYKDHRHICPFEDICWYSGWIMCGSAMICPYLPERVLRQFGHVQSIPRHPDESAKADLNRFTIAEAFVDYLVDNYVTEQMRGPRAQNGFETEPGYIAWFYRVLHPKLWPPIEGNPARPTNLEAMIKEDNAADKQDVFKICRTIIEEVNGKLDGELTLEEAREVLKKVVRDLEPVATYSLPVKRKRDSDEGSKKRKKKKKST